MRLRQRDAERTLIQESGPFDPHIAVPADAIMVHGLRWRLPEKVAGWKEAGYITYAMTSVAWGSVGGYLRGEWDGHTHFGDVQVDASGKKLAHGQHDTYYMVPSHSFTMYLIELAKAAVQTGVKALVLEEPEFWVDGAYSPGFQDEWFAHYDEAWQDPQSSPTASYRAAQLQRYLFLRAIAHVCHDVKAYAHKKGLTDFRCYVATHSVLNYAQWRIVSPAAQLAYIADCDGIIGQVWTGTARHPNMYRGRRRSRPFETALCEYAAIAALLRDTNKSLWFLADPIADDPRSNWAHYRKHWHDTLTASLLFPEVTRFEVMPWPRRVFLRPQARRPPWVIPSAKEARTLREKLRLAAKSTTTLWSRFGLPAWGDTARLPAFAQRAVSAARLYLTTPRNSAAPPDYAVELQIVFNALTDMEWPSNQIEWLTPAPPVAICLSDTLQFERGDVRADPDLSAFYGLALPLVACGLPVRTLFVERANDPEYLDATQVILLTYDGMKPPSADCHTALAAWVKRGGTLIFFGQGDAFDGIGAWWNKAGFAHPREHLLSVLGLAHTTDAGLHACGSGAVILISDSPVKLALSSSGAERVRSAARVALARHGHEWPCRDVIVLRRGPYVIGAGLSEGAHPHPYRLKGVYIDLFDAGLAVVRNPRLAPGTRRLLYDLVRGDPGGAWVVAASGRVANEYADEHSLTCTIQGATDTRLVLRMLLPRSPQRVETCVTTGDATPRCYEWDAPTRTLLVTAANDPKGVQVRILW